MTSGPVHAPAVQFDPNVHTHHLYRIPGTNKFEVREGAPAAPMWQPPKRGVAARGGGTVAASAGATVDDNGVPLPPWELAG